jgi:hypothetical protein
VPADDLGDLDVGDAGARSVQPTLQTAQGFAGALATGDGGQDLSHGRIDGDETFAPATEQGHLEAGLLFGGQPALLKLSQKKTQLLRQGQRRLHG